MSENGLENFVSLVTALAALGGVIAAWAGLFTWKTQAKWNIDADLARKILVAMFKHKDAIANVRHPAIFGDEVEDAIAGLELPEGHTERRYLETTKIYELRWSAVSEIRSQIYPLLLEAEAVWGREARDLFQPVWRLQTELRIVIQNYIRAINPNLSAERREAAQKSLSKKRDIMYDSLEDDEDEFKHDYADAMRAIENFMRSKLGRTP